jgi:putative Mg2+ transporter-C (MgtC) family protein
MESLLELKMLGYLAGAMVLGAVIGFEREVADKPAGMRTHMLVAGASALLVLVGEALVARFGNELRPGLVRGDPIRIIESIVAGIAFLGAGTIIRRGGTTVQGLTTAATVLFTAAVGICVASKEVVLAIGATLLALATLRLLAVVETWLKRKSPVSRGAATSGSGQGK